MEAIQALKDQKVEEETESCGRRDLSGSDMELEIDIACILKPPNRCGPQGLIGNLLPPKDQRGKHPQKCRLAGQARSLQTRAYGSNLHMLLCCSTQAAFAKKLDSSQSLKYLLVSHLTTQPKRRLSMLASEPHPSTFVPSIWLGAVFGRKD